MYCQLMDRRLYNISFLDLAVLAALSEHKSLRSLSRSLDLEPPRVTKILQSISLELQAEILKTSPHGYVLTADGLHMSDQASQLIKKSEDFLSRKSRGALTRTVLTVGGRGFMNVFFAGPLLQGVQAGVSSSSLRFIDLSPEELRYTAFEGVLDVALHLEEIDWPQTWSAAEVGEMTWDLYVGANHPLKGTVSRDDLLKYPFTRSAYWNGRAIAQAADNFSIPGSERLPGHEMQTAMTNLEIIQHSDNVGLLPDIIANKHVKAGLIRNISVRGLQMSRSRIYLSVRNEKISNKLFKQWQQILRARLKDV